MRISDWSSDVCSSDLVELAARILERGKAALIFGELFGIRLVRAGQAADQHRQEHERAGKHEPDAEEQQDRHILRQADRRERAGERRGGTECGSTCRERGSATT